jgi:membrane-associated phospholipid phosphatase
MILAFQASSIDGAAYRDVVDTAQHAPTWVNDVISVWSTYGLAVFAVLMLVGWWRARQVGAGAAVTALAVPVVVVIAYGIDSLLKLAVDESRPCQSLHVTTVDTCPAAGDWSFPSNHATIAGAAAVALFFVSRRLGAVAAVAALAIAASRVWVGVHYPHDVVAGILVGALVALGASALSKRWPEALARRITATRLRPLLTS